MGLKTPDFQKREPEARGKLTPDTDVCQCAGCEEVFQTVKGFDRHRTGPATDRRCLTPDEMRGIGMVINTFDRWGTKPYTGVRS